MGEYFIGSDGELYHYGVKGMKWGVRRYQNKDGSLTTAGKKRLATSIQKAAKDTSTTGRKQLRQDIADDLNTNYKSQITHHIANIREKKKLYDELDKPENDYWESDQHVKDSATAYKNTVDWFKQNDPEYLGEIVKRNGGSDKKLDAYHDFRKVFDGYQDEAWTRGEVEFYKRKRIDPTDKDRAWRDYNRACRDAAHDILGEHGRMLVSRLPVTGYRGSVEMLVTDTFNLELERFD